MTGFIKQKFPLIILAFLFILMVIPAMLSEGYFGGADNITHYLISHYAFKYPHLFLNSWGRPLYTILSAPFAQFGLTGAKLLNILLGLATAWFAFRIATMLNIRHAFAVIIFVCFTPLYFMMMPTALTEILFSFVLMASVFLFIRGDYRASAIVISFLPFARTEGFILLPLFFLAVIWARQFKALPFLATGVIFFSILGSFYYKDIFWVFTQFPYPVTYHHPIYNKAGSLWHFFESRDSTLGLPLELLFLGGILAMVRDLFSKDEVTRHRVHLLAFLALGPFILYFVFHSVLFWKAMGGSMGLERVLAAVMPVAALVALKGFEALDAIIGKKPWMSYTFLALTIAAVAVTPWMKYAIPFPLTPEEKTIKEAVAWIGTSPYASRQIYYTDNNVPYYLGADPYQKPALVHLFGDAKYLDTIPAGSLLVWDAHFGANESKVPLDSLLGNHHQQLVKYFRPDEPWITFGGYKYECMITTILAPGQSADNYAIRDSLVEIADARSSVVTLLYQNFESPGSVSDISVLSRDTVHKGNFSFRMDGRTEFSPGICQYVKDPGISKHDSLPPGKAPKYGIRAAVYVYLPGPANKSNTLLVISFEHKNKSYSYTSLNLNEQKLRSNSWNRICLTAEIPAFKASDDLLKVYTWNPGRQVFYMDDLRVEVVKE